MDPALFTAHVADAYNHLYDLVYLRTHPLAAIVTPQILQRLSNHPDTQGIPVVICSILRARQLALALGAAAFLEKPVGEMEFVRVLDSLTAGERKKM